jgi:Ca-activated chloride channel family protein
MAERTKSNFMFLVDASYSMQGSLAYSAVDALKGALKQVKKTDNFNIVLFGTETRCLRGFCVKGSKSNKRNAIRFVRNAECPGGTDFASAMRHARGLMSNYNPCLYVIITDGNFST